MPSRIELGRARAAVLGAAALLVCGTALIARAERPPLRQVGVPSPGRSIAADDQASAIAVNPANLAFMAAPELRWMWVRTNPGTDTDLGSPDPGRGHAFDLAFPMFGRLGTGLRLDFVRPAPRAFPIDQPYNLLTWGLGVRANDGYSIGLSIGHAYSGDRNLDGATQISVATSIRPSPYLSVSVVGRNLNGPSLEMDPEVDIGFAVRPTGRRQLEIGLEDRYVDGTGDWLPRVTLGLDVPYLGRVRGEIATSDPTLPGKLYYTATAGLELGWGTAAAEGGAVFGSALRNRHGSGFYTGFAFTGYRNPGLPEGGYALKIRIEQTPGTRGHVALLRRLWGLAADRELKAVAFVFKAEPADSLAHAEELGDAVRMLRANGKKVVCHLEDAQGRALYVCSQADRVVLHPAGVIRFAGLKSQYQYYASLLDKIGIRAQFVRVGPHKSAPEAFMRDSASDVARADHLDLLNEANRVFLSDVGGGRRIATGKLQDTFAHGPFVAAEATTAGLVDGVAFDDEIDGVVSETLGSRVRLRDEPRPAAAPARFGMRRRIALVYVEGDMVNGRSRTIPLLGTRLVGSYTIAKTLKDVRENPSVAAVVLRIESPGGSSVAADVMWREARLVADKKPLVVSMGTYAASGGYYVASAGASVWANPLSITGSIGIFYGKADVAELLKKIGMSVETYKTTPRADGESIFRPYTPEELAELQKKVQQLYDLFVDRVALSRKLPRQDVDHVGQGRVWSGRQAFDRKLVDHLGGLREALADARHRANLPFDAPIEELPVPEMSLLGIAARLAGAAEPEGADAAPLVPRQLLDLVRALAPFTIYDPDEPLARLELAPLSAP